MNSRETFRAKVNETFSKNSLGIILTEIRYEYVWCFKLGKKGDFSAFFQKNIKEKYSAPVRKMHIYPL